MRYDSVENIDDESWLAGQKRMSLSCSEMLPTSAVVCVALLISQAGETIVEIKNARFG